MSRQAHSPIVSERETAAPGFHASLVDSVLAGERLALAKAITLVESTRPDHQLQAQALLQALLPHTGGATRIGISGVPGVGKSTFIEALGLRLIKTGHRVAVLAVDPSSRISGGSILGDKTRMELLAQNEEAFIRPSPSAGSLGGVADKTREAILLCEAAGFDVVIVETVGVGQSETTVAGMVDAFVLLQLPNAGDDLQAIKRGIIELADIVVINKADLDAVASRRAQQQMEGGLSFLRPHAHPAPNWKTPVLVVSALEKTGIDEFWAAVGRFRDALAANGELAEKRRRQKLEWMSSLIDCGLRANFHRHPGVRAKLDELSAAVADGRMTPATAADALLAIGRLATQDQGEY